MLERGLFLCSCPFPLEFVNLLTFCLDCPTSFATRAFADVYRLDLLDDDDLVKGESAEPTSDQFTRYEDYVAAKAEYRADKRLEEHLSKLDRTIQGRTAEQTQAEKLKSFVAEAKVQGKGIEDFEDALETVRGEIRIGGVVGRIERGADRLPHRRMKIDDQREPEQTEQAPAGEAGPGGDRGRGRTRCSHG